MTGRLAVVGGHSILGTGFAAAAARLDVAVPDSDGTVPVLDTGDCVVLQRHGLDQFSAAPYIDHIGNLRALVAAGCDRILALGSTGSLRPELPVGTFVVPDDFIAFQVGLSCARDGSGHQIPGFDPEWRRTVVGAWEANCDVPIVDGGVYWQTIGPRFETRAEIRLMVPHAELVGMTIASECTVARELGLAYAAVCIVDNLAHGIGERELTLDEFHAGARRNQERLVGALDRVLPVLAEAAR